MREISSGKRKDQGEGKGKVTMYKIHPCEQVFLKGIDIFEDLITNIAQV